MTLPFLRPRRSPLALKRGHFTYTDRAVPGAALDRNHLINPRIASRSRPRSELAFDIMFSDHLFNIYTQLAHRWNDADLGAFRPRSHLPILVAQALLLVLLIDYGRMLWLRSKMVRDPPATSETRKLTEQIYSPPAPSRSL